MIEELEKRLKEKADNSKAKLLQRFFKTGKGEYGEGDIFLGISVPEQRKIAKEFCNLSIDEIQELLNSEIHEKRLIALLILIEKYKRAEDIDNPPNKVTFNRGFSIYPTPTKSDTIKGIGYDEKEKIVNFYLKNARNNKINNWDLVDLSCHQIIGNYLLDKNREILYQLANSENLWEKRIAVISTFAFIKNNDFEGTLRISEILLKDRHDLIHKAIGWMLREVGKRDKKILEDFLKKHCRIMPRTMLRYAIEKFNDSERKKWLNGGFS